MLREAMPIADLGTFRGGVFGLLLDRKRKIILHLHYNGGFQNSLQPL